MGWITFKRLTMAAYPSKPEPPETERLRDAPDGAGRPRIPEPAACSGMSGSGISCVRTQVSGRVFEGAPCALAGFRSRKASCIRMAFVFPVVPTVSGIHMAGG